MMSERTIRNEGSPGAPVDEQERIRRQNVDEFKRLCDQIGAEAQARGVTEKILNEILSEEPTAEEVTQNRSRTQEFQAVVGKGLKVRLYRPKR